ncbi:hypothetical protein F4804DRAFT_259326 [Jackrogersella minutella]|nr:hypothetical protein F4804DRAFT_259326 [Jackrogersella minutella]
MTTDDNPFIRFKNHIDNNIQRGFHAVFGLLATTETPEAKNKNYGISSSSNSNNMSTSNTDRALSQSKPESSTRKSDMESHDEGYACGRDILKWVVHSSYSPVNIQSLPHPRPHDAPPQCSTTFTFSDAFEDLLEVSSGRPLLPLKQFEMVRSREWDYWPWGRPIPEWINDIQERNLWSAYFRLNPSFRSSQIFNCQDPRHYDGFLLVRKYNETPSEPGGGTAGCRAADSEDELYAATHSKFATDIHAGVNTARREQNNIASRPAQKPSSPDSEETPVSQTVETPDGGKILRTIQLRTFDSGAQTTTTTRQYDADGNLIAQGDETTKTWSYTWPKRTSGSNDKERSDLNAGTTASSTISGEATVRGSGKVSGWFWTR